jgi:hypothetical protein
MRGWLIALTGLLIAWPALAADSTELAPPVKIRAGGKPIDIDLGQAAPFLADLNGDGVRCLLLGQAGDGQLRVYRSVSKGKRQPPRFDSFSWFGDGQSGSRVPAAADAGFTPCVVDLDGDGIPDVLSGSAGGEIYFFKGKGDGKFADGVVLKGQDKAAINVGRASTVFAYDWDGDGVPDLIVGTGAGRVYLVPNKGSASQYAFGKPQRLMADDKEIQVASGYAFPVVADWDGDGRPDLIVGTGAGSVLWYRNRGTHEAPKLEAGRTLVAESVLAKNATAVLGDGQWGLRARICVVDWDGDGRPDLLLGDYYLQKQPPTAADRTAARKARHDLERLQKDYKHALQKVQDLQKVPANETTKARRQREKDLKSIRESAAKMDRDIALAQKNLAKLEHPVRYHGHVWLFLRSSLPGDTK